VQAIDNAHDAAIINCAQHR